MAITEFYAVVSEGEVNTEANTSVVNVSLYVSWNSGSYAADSPQYSITIDGESLTGTADFNTDRETYGTDVLVVTRTKTVTHNENGQKSVSVSAWYEGQRKGEGAVYTCTAEKVLTAIARGLMRIRVNGAYKQAAPYIRVNGAWKRATALVKAGQTWQTGI